MKARVIAAKEVLGEDLVLWRGRQLHVASVEHDSSLKQTMVHVRFWNGDDLTFPEDAPLNVVRQEAG